MSIDLQAYEDAKQSIKVLECDECKKEFLLESVNIETLHITDKSKGLYFEYKYFLCPKCGQPYTVCIDDELSLLQEKIYMAQREKVVRKKNRGRLKESDVEKLSKKRKQLLRRRDMLLKEYSKVFTEIAKQNSDKISTVTNNTDNTKKEEVK